MANHSSDPTAADAREALGLLDLDGARLAARLVTPWWYHVVLGGILALIAVATALPGAASPVVVAVGAIGMVALPIVYRRRYGVSVTSPAGPRSRRLLIVVLGVFVAAMLSGVALKLTGTNPWWVLVPAALAAVVTVVLGRRYDEALRRELAAGTAGAAGSA